MKTRRDLEKIRNELVLLKLKMFPPAVIRNEPRVIALADNTPNPHGKIVPPNSPVTPGRKL